MNLIEAHMKQMMKTFWLIPIREKSEPCIISTMHIHKNRFKTFKDACDFAEKNLNEHWEVIR